MDGKQIGHITQSEMVINLLKGYDEEKTFTTATLKQELRDVSSGAITGTIDRLLKADAISIKETTRGLSGRLLRVYRIVDMSGVESRPIKSRGGVVGRKLTGKSKKQSIIDTLLLIAEQVEAMKGDLEDFSTDQLLKEIKRRTEK